MAINLCTRSSFQDKLKTELSKVLNSAVIKDGGHSSTKTATALVLPDDRKSFTAYKLDGCPYSEEAGVLLRNVPNAVSTYVYADLKMHKTDLQRVLHDQTSFDKHRHNTFPIVFKGADFIGGCQELKHHLQMGVQNRHAGGPPKGRSTRYKRTKTRRFQKRNPTSSKSVFQRKGRKQCI